MRILVLNAGSSSLKFAVFDGGLGMLLKGQVSGIGSKPRLEVEGQPSREVPHVTTPTEGLLVAAEWLSDNGHEPARFNGIGHRIVHGGTQYVTPVAVNDAVQHDLEALRALAPLHLPFGLGVLREMRRVAPEVPNIACFDTAFHATQPELATRLPLPRAYFDKGYRRYGFHGLNYQHVVEALPRLTGKPLPRRLLAAHLGSGASMCAIFDGKSVATTMGFSTADGLVMGTRTGSIDPGVLVALMRDEHLSLDQLEDLLYRGAASSASPAFQPTCACCWRATGRRPSRRSTIIAIPPRAMPPRWCLRWAARMPSSSPAAWARMRGRSGRASCRTSSGWACRWRMSMSFPRMRN
jgi:acetate kinase